MSLGNPLGIYMNKTSEVVLKWLYNSAVSGSSFFVWMNPHILHLHLLSALYQWDTWFVVEHVAVGTRYYFSLLFLQLCKDKGHTSCSVPIIRQKIEGLSYIHVHHNYDQCSPALHRRGIFFLSYNRASPSLDTDKSIDDLPLDFVYIFQGSVFIVFDWTGNARNFHEVFI